MGETVFFYVKVFSPIILGILYFSSFYLFEIDPQKTIIINFLFYSLIVAWIVALIFSLQRSNDYILVSLENLQKERSSLQDQMAGIVVKTNRLENKILRINRLTLASLPKTNLVKPSSKPDLEQYTENTNTEQLELEINKHLKKQTSNTSYVYDIELTWEILLKALNFPDDAKDMIGFEALKIANQNKPIADLLRASEDFLNLLAHQGIYLDDLNFDKPSVEAWRNFSSNELPVSAKKLDCIGIEQHFDKLKARMRSDTIFRDSAFILIRRFDQLMKEKLSEATDQQVFSISNTRTGKAFLIIGKISDIF